MRERMRKVLGDRRVQAGCLLAVHTGFTVYVLTTPVPMARWLVALVAAGLGAQIVNFIGLVRLGTVTDLLEEVKELNESVKKRHAEALELIEDVEGADAIAVLRDGKVVNSHVIRVPKGSLH